MLEKAHIFKSIGGNCLFRNNVLPSALLCKAHPIQDNTLKSQEVHRNASLVLINAWNGLTDRIHYIADTMVAASMGGHIVLVAESYSGRKGSKAEEKTALMRKTLADPETLIDNLNVAARYLDDRPDTVLERWPPSIGAAEVESL